MNLLTTTLNWLSLNWKDVAVIALPVAGVLSLLLETLLKKLKIDNKKIAYTLIHVFSIVTAVATYFIGNIPTADVPAIYAGLVIAAQTWHRFAISPVYTKYIIPFLEYQSQTKTSPKSTTEPTVAPQQFVD